MIKSFKKLASNDRVVTQLQENVEQAINPLLKNPLLDGVLIKDVKITTGTTLMLSHRLSRKAQGYIITKQNANAIIWNGELGERTLELNSSANVTIDVWIY